MEAASQCHIQNPGARHLHNGSEGVEAILGLTDDLPARVPCGQRHPDGDRIADLERLKTQ
jgi:hypothetical protein